MEIATDHKQKDEALELSIQRRADVKAANGMVFPWWFVSSDEYEIAPWWSEQRDKDLRAFVRREGNDILQGAISSLVKKFKAMAWALDGPQRVIGRYQEALARCEFGQGWGALLSKVLYDYLTQDKGAFIEVIGRGDQLGPIEGPAVSLAHLDAGLCQLTGDPIYPVVYNNPKDGLPHKIHASRVIHLVDMPAPNEEMLGIGFCGTSRVIASSSVLLKLARYKNEKLSDMPEAGLLLLNNIMRSQWDDVKADHDRGRRKINHEIWNNIITLLGIDPSQPVSAEFISFANLPDAFDEQSTTTIYVNIVALALGVDAREFWPISSGALGTASEAETMHQKAKGKGIGELISAIERAINWQLLPPSVTFRFDFRDDEEDQLKAQINQLKVDTIMKMWVSKPGADASISDPPVSRLEIRQMLADNVPEYFKEEFLEVDISEEEELTDTDQEVEKAYGRKTTVDHLGRVKTPRRLAEQNQDKALALAEENYKAGRITLDQLLEFRLGAVLDNKFNEGTKHPGHPDQKIHGRRGGEIQVRLKESITSGVGEVQSYGLKTGKEALVGYDADGNKISEMVKGDKHGVGGKKADRVMSESFVTIHNHPSSASFSDNDIHSFVSSPNARHMVVIGHDGTIYKLSKPDNYSQEISLDEVASRWNVSERALNPEYTRRVVLGRENRNAVWKDHTHRIVEDLSSQLGLDYERVER